ncbi:MAG: hypothetical protein OEY41_09020 [Acidimicrobiia bacterium]|nr:hypothetical protein [Acidimicrobiia bacterium]MDH5290128.1 hypothetical protein [Acidimicrobiia bacterium]
MFGDLLAGLTGLTFVAIVLLVTTFPSTWLLMLFLGNLGLGLGYWATLPLGILVSTLIGGSTSGVLGRHRRSI